MLECTPLEKIILADIQDRTGLSFRKLGGIDTRDAYIAMAVLPILAEWVAKVDDRSHRCGIYHRFHTPHASPYVEQLISWWTNESDELSLSFLTQNLALVVECADAQRVWKLCQVLPPRPCHYMLLSKLARCSAVAPEAKDALVRPRNRNSAGGRFVVHCESKRSEDTAVVRRAGRFFGSKHQGCRAASDLCWRGLAIRRVGMMRSAPPDRRWKHFEEVAWRELTPLVRSGCERIRT